MTSMESVMRCDACGAKADGDAVDFVYSWQNPQNPCRFHDLCTNCASRMWRDKIECPACAAGKPKSGERSAEA
jgi:hypothetical protein